MKIDRRDLLNRLLAVGPGIVKSDMDQSTCVVLRKGRFYTLNREIACSIVSGLPPEMEGALEADKVIALLKELPEEQIDVSIKDSIFRIRGDGRFLRAAMKEEILLPIDDVERPKTWIRLKETFGEAIGLTHPCTKRKGEFVQQCVHIHPQWLEASDDICMLRYPLKTFVSESILVRGRTIKVVEDLGMTLGAETNNWIHFKNPMGLRVSLKKTAVESYPPLETFLELRGKKILLPKGFSDITKRASNFCGENGLSVCFMQGRVLVEGRDGLNKYSEEKPISYKGETISFSVPPKLMKSILEKSNQCEITDVSLRVNGGNFIYCTSLKD